MGPHPGRRPTDQPKPQDNDLVRDLSHREIHSPTVQPPVLPLNYKAPEL